MIFGCRVYRLGRTRCIRIPSGFLRRPNADMFNVQMHSVSVLGCRRYPILGAPGMYYS